MALSCEMQPFFKLLIISLGLLDLISRMHHDVFEFVQDLADERYLCFCMIAMEHMRRSIVQPLRLTKCVSTCQNLLTSEFLDKLVTDSENEAPNDFDFMFIRSALCVLYSQLYAIKPELHTILTADPVINQMPDVDLTMWGEFKNLVPATLEELHRILPVIMRNFLVDVERPPEPCLGVAHHFYVGREVFRLHVEKLIQACAVRHPPDFRHPLHYS